MAETLRQVISEVSETIREVERRQALLTTDALEREHQQALELRSKLEKLSQLVGPAAPAEVSDTPHATSVAWWKDPDAGVFDAAYAASTAGLQVGIIGLGDGSWYYTVFASGEDGFGRFREVGIRLSYVRPHLGGARKPKEASATAEAADLEVPGYSQE